MHWLEPDKREERLFTPGKVRYGSPGDGESYEGADDD